MPAYETISEYARRCGRNRTTIFQHCKSGKIIKTDDGINTTLPLNREYEQKCKAKLIDESASRGKAKATTQTRRKPRNGNGNGQSLDAFQEADLVTKEEAEKQKLIEQVLNYQVKTQKERQELVERALVKRVWAKLYAVDTAELHPLGEKIAADLAAEFKSDDSEAILKVRKIIDRHIFKALQHSKRLMDDFLVKIGEEKL